MRTTTNGTRCAVQSFLDWMPAALLGHSLRVASYAGLIAAQMGLSAARRSALRVAALTHDVGKLSVPTGVLSKGASLTAAEFAVVRGHAVVSFEMLSKVSFSGALEQVPAIAVSHHEWADGQGYPRAASILWIPLEGRILAVADVFDALTAPDRPYRRALSSRRALVLLRRGSGSHFDPEVVAAALAVARAN
jgi:putative nucleotidyltransferase with HDIG domain